MTDNVPNYTPYSYSEQRVEDYEQNVSVTICLPILEDSEDTATMLFGKLPDEDISPADLIAITAILLGSDGTGGGSDTPTPIISDPYHDGTVTTPDTDDQDIEPDKSSSTSFWEEMPADMTAWFDDEPRYSECLSDNELDDNA